MTKRDLTGSNEGLVAFAGRILLGLPRTALTAEAPEADGDAADRPHAWASISST